MIVTRIDKRVLGEMVAHAQREYPLECCGLLSGKGKRIEQAIAVTNLRESRTEYFAAPEELLDFFRRSRDNGCSLLGIYHSHPASSAFPSRPDIENFHYPDAGYWIVSLREPLPEVRCFRWTGSDFLEVDYHVEPNFAWEDS